MHTDIQGTATTWLFNVVIWFVYTKQHKGTKCAGTGSKRGVAMLP